MTVVFLSLFFVSKAGISSSNPAILDTNYRLRVKMNPGSY